MHDQFTAPMDDRLDRLLAARPQVGSRRRARQAIETGKVFVGGAPCTEAGHPVPAGTPIEIRWNRPGSARDRHRADRDLSEAGVRIVHQDAHLIAVDKPPGLLTDTASRTQHRTRDSVWKRLRAVLRAAGQRPRTVHRIDRDTSGLVLFAATDAAEAHLRDQFRNHRPTRVYRALVLGHPRPDTATWEDHTRWHRGRRILEAVPPQAPGARPTRCSVRVIRRDRDFSELEIALDTGRRNQIRLQAALRGHPLLGEKLYVDRPVGPPAPRQLLHAHVLEVVHPATGAPLRLTAPLPPDWR